MMQFLYINFAMSMSSNPFLNLSFGLSYLIISCDTSLLLVSCKIFIVDVFSSYIQYEREVG